MKDILYFNKMDAIGEVRNGNNIRHVYSVPFTLSDESKNAVSKYGFSGKVVIRERMEKALDNLGYVLYNVAWDNDFIVVTKKA